MNNVVIPYRTLKCADVIQNKKHPPYILTLVLPLTSSVDINVSGAPSVGLICGLKTDQVNLIIKHRIQKFNAAKLMFCREKYIKLCCILQCQLRFMLHRKLYQHDSLQKLSNPRGLRTKVIHSFCLLVCGKRLKFSHKTSY
jgi:hypothetical protein